MLIALQSLKLPLALGAVLAVSALGLYVTHGLKQAGAAKVERSMYRAVLERNAQEARRQRASIEELRDLERVHRARADDLKAQLQAELGRIPDAPPPEDAQAAQACPPGCLIGRFD